MSRLTEIFGVPSLTHVDDYLEHHAKAAPTKAAVVFETEMLTYADLDALVTEKAGALAALLGTSRQKIVGLFMPNGLDYVIAYLAVIRSGHIALPIDVIFKPLEINAVIHQMRPKLILTDNQGKGRLATLTEAVLRLDDLPPRSTKKVDFLRLPADQQITSLLFTSGTTGHPKAAPHTHANDLWNIKVCSRVWGWDSRETLLVSLRLSHWYGLVMGLTGSLYHGNSLYLQAGFDPEQTLKELASGRISHFPHTPYAYAKMLETAGDYDLSAVRLLISGSAPLPPPVWEAFKQRFGYEIIECYGSSETGRIAANDLSDRQPGSAGLILPEVEARLSSRGELLIRSPGVFPGYWHNQTATRVASEPGGWWHTGDLGEINGQRLYLRGRSHEVIRRFGYTVSPRDVEWAMHQCPEVSEIHVVGRSRADSPSDELVYFVVARGSEGKIQDFYKTNLPSVWRPDQVIFLDGLPRTAMGKVSLPKLRAMLK